MIFITKSYYQWRTQDFRMGGIEGVGRGYPLLIGGRVWKGGRAPLRGKF